MRGVLPPQYIKGVAGFFLSEAATQNIHAQFIVHGGCTYGGYADLARESRKIWTIADVLELESRAGARTLTFDWFPVDCISCSTQWKRSSPFFIDIECIVFCVSYSLSPHATSGVLQSMSRGLPHPRIGRAHV